jgi:hypothetical protein
MEFAFVSGEHNIEVFIHSDLVINVINFVSKHLHLIKDMAKEWIDHDIRTPLVAEWALPPLVL